MKRIRKRDILSGVLAIIAVANLVLLFKFDYEIFGFEWDDFFRRKFSQETEVTAQAVTGATAQATTSASTESSAIAETTDEKAGTAGTSEAMSADDGASTAENVTEEASTRKCRVISSKNARIRSGPGTEYERITSVPRETILMVLDVEDNGWVHVRTDDGVEGYVSGDLIEFIDEE